MSVRFGMEVSAFLLRGVRLHKFDETVEEVRGVVWSRTGFWVVLHRERWDVEAADAFNNLVVEADV